MLLRSLTNKIMKRGPYYSGRYRFEELRTSSINRETKKLLLGNPCIGRASQLDRLLHGLAMSSAMASVSVSTGISRLQYFPIFFRHDMQGARIELENPGKGAVLFVATELLDEIAFCSACAAQALLTYEIFAPSEQKRFQIDLNSRFNLTFPKDFWAEHGTLGDFFPGKFISCSILLKKEAIQMIIFYQWLLRYISLRLNT